jgi:hypothetical protein
MLTTTVATSTTLETTANSCHAEEASCCPSLLATAGKSTEYAEIYARNAMMLGNV